MIIANENELLEPMVTTSLSEHDDGVIAITKLMIVSDLLEKKKYVDENVLRIILGLETESMKRKEN